MMVLQNKIYIKHTYKKQELYNKIKALPDYRLNQSKENLIKAEALLGDSSLDLLREFKVLDGMQESNQISLFG